MLKYIKDVRKNFVLIILVTGFSGIVAQIVILRELLVSFFGNEFSIGVILANWLIVESAGAYIFSKKVEKSNPHIEHFVFLQVLFAIFLPLSIYFARILRTAIPIISGQGIGLIPLFLSSFLVLLPVSFIHGALFTFTCQLYYFLIGKEKISVPGPDNNKEQSIGTVYILETIGTLLGGVFFTYLLLPKFNSFQIGIGISIINVVLCLYYLILYHLKNPILTKYTKFIYGSLIIVLVLLIYVVFGYKIKNLHEYSINKQWHNQNVVYYHNSKYENITVTKSNNQYSFFLNGIPSITIPIPDIASIEDFVHLPMLSHHNPEKVLIIGEGVGGVIESILKHPVKKIDYVELDPDLIKTVEMFSTPLIKRELNNNKVNVIYKDGRLFTNETKEKYDIVFIGFSLPVDLQINRLFTLDFFKLVKEKLRDKGILVLSLPGSLSYLNEALKRVNACILNTLKQVYPFVKVIPGDSNIFLASFNKQVENINTQILSYRIKDRNIDTNLLVPGYLNYKLSLSYKEWFYSEIAKVKTMVNRDFKPIGVFYSLAYWNDIFSPYMNYFFEWVQIHNVLLIYILLCFFMLILIIFYFKNRILLSKREITKFPFRFYALSKASIPYAIITTGFAGMIFDIMLIFIFQALYGYVYYWMGILIAMFMTGTAMGAYWVNSKIKEKRKTVKLLLKMEVSLIIFTVILPLTFIFLSYNFYGNLIFFKIVFVILCFVSGIIIGMEFPLANRLHLKLTKKEREKGIVSGTAGLLYGCDLFGGWIGGIIGGVVLLPVLGLIATSLTIVFIKLSSFAILFLVWICNNRNMV